MENEIKKLREKMLMSQGEFAVVLGVSTTMVSMYERGKHKPTQHKILRKLMELQKKYEKERF